MRVYLGLCVVKILVEESSPPYRRERSSPTSGIRCRTPPYFSLLMFLPMMGMSLTRIGSSAELKG